MNKSELVQQLASRADLKSDLLQELDRQRAFLEALRSNPAISEAKLEGVLREIDVAFANLHATSGKTGQSLRENEWLMSIKQRTNIPGGICEFDLPSYHYWLHLTPQEQREAIILIGAEGMSYEDAAEALGVKVGTVRSRIHRGRMQLRDALAHRAPPRGRTRFLGAVGV